MKLFRPIFLLIFLISSIKISSQTYFLKLYSLQDSTSVFNKIKEQTNKEFTHFKAFKTLKEKGLDRVFVLDFGKPVNENDFGINLEKISKIEGVELFEVVPNYQFFHTPNDYNSTSNWNLEKIQARDAWDIERGGKGIVVALIDDGMDTAHQDLNYALWKNQNEIPGNNTDDDNNGYIDDFMGWDMADNDNIPHVNQSDNLSHGTHCGGIIGAKSNNNVGISSIGYDIKLMVLKCGRNGQRSIYNPYQAVEYAIENGARVLSMSWGGGSYSSVYQTLFDLAYQRNIVCVAAAGNSSTSTAMYPAGYDYVISVGSTTSTDAKSGFSNYGSTIDVMAPGSGIYSTLPGNNYGNMSGTSMACPLVSGLCALMLSRNNRLTAQQVENCLESTCDSIDHLNNGFRGQLGAGRINAYRALRCVKGLYAEFTSSKKVVCTGDTVKFTCTTTPTPSSYYWEFQGGTPAFSTAQSPIIRYNTNGSYSVKLRVIRSNDTDEVNFTNYIIVGKPTVRFSGVQTINRGEYATIRMDFTGVGPWTVIYRNKNRQDTVKNISSNPYFLLKQPDSSIVYKPLKVFQNNCEGTVRDSTKITVTQLSGTQLCDSSLRFHATFGGSGDDQITHIKMANDSIIYVVGRTTTNSLGNYDAFVAKINIKGTIIWSKSIGGSSEDGFWGLIIDNKENVYCAGYTNSNVSTRASALIKLDKNGNLKWTRYHDGLHTPYAYAIDITKDQNNITIVGQSHLNGHGGEDLTIYNYDSTGSLRWLKQIGSSNTDRPYDIVSDSSNNFYVLGTHYDGSIFKNVLAKLDNNGNLSYSYFLTNTSYNCSYLHGANHVNRFIYTTGIATSGSNINLTLTKFNINGTLVWSKLFNYNVHSYPKIRIHNNRIYIIDRSTINSKISGNIFEFDTSGYLLKSRKIEHNSNNISLMDLELNNQGEIIYGGFQMINNNEFLIGKLNCKFNGFCLTTNITPNYSNILFSRSSTGFNIKNYNNPTSPGHSLRNFTSNNINYFCKSNSEPTKSPKCKLQSYFTFTQGCVGDTINFSATAIDSNGYNITPYLWDFGDNSTLSGGKDAKKVYQTKGNFSVKLVVLSSLNGFNCADTVLKNISITDSLKIVNGSFDTTICIGDSIQLKSPLMLCGAKPYQYKWTPNTNISSSIVPNPLVAPKVSTTYFIELKDQNGKIAKDSFKITVNPNCCKSFARISTDKETYCQGDSILYINNSSFDAGSAFFKWTFKNANISQFIGKNPPKVVFSNTQIEASLELYDMCSNDTEVLKMNYFPKPTIFMDKNKTVCKGDTIEIGEEQIGRRTYLWLPNLNIDNNQKSNPKVLANSNIIYTVKMTDDVGCEVNDSVKIEVKPMAGFDSPKDTTVCENLPVTFILPNLPEFKYLWSNNSTDFKLKITDSGQYFVRVSSSCGDSTYFFKVNHQNCSCPFFIPTAFTPNKDGANENFKIYFGCEITDLSLEIYNRWGEKVFETSDPNFEWNGEYKDKTVQQGFYLVQIKFRKNTANLSIFERESFYLNVLR